MKPNSPKPVSARIEPMVIPTYPALAPEPNPMFFETRNVQGSKGNIYPHPFIDQISSQKVDQTYQAVVLENEYVKMVLLPELGAGVKPLIKAMQLAFVAHNSQDWAEFLVCAPTPVGPGIKVHHYSRVVRLENVVNRLFAV